MLPPCEPAAPPLPTTPPPPATPPRPPAPTGTPAPPLPPLPQMRAPVILMSLRHWSSLRCHERAEATANTATARHMVSRPQSYQAVQPSHGKSQPAIAPAPRPTHTSHVRAM